MLMSRSITHTAKTSRALVFVFRAVVLLGCVGWCIYFAAMFRTAGFGFFYRGFFDGLVVPLILMTIIAPLPFLGHGGRCMTIGGTVILTVSFIAAEGFGRAQEILVVRQYGATPTQSLTVTRWWPFEHHSIFYSPGYGWSGCD